MEDSTNLLFARWSAVLSGFETVVPDPMKPDPAFNNAVRMLPRPLDDLLRNECSPTPALRQVALDIGEALRTDPGRLRTLSAARLRNEIRARAAAYYETIWAGLSQEEKLVLADPARDGLLNPKAAEAVHQLVRKGLLRISPVRLLNATFRDFILTGGRIEECQRWEADAARASGSSAWTAAVVIVWLAFTTFLMVTQPNLVQASISWVSGGLGALALIPKLLGWFTGRIPKGSGVGA
jgi:hypothetical protein